MPLNSSSVSSEVFEVEESRDACVEAPALSQRFPRQHVDCSRIGDVQRRRECEQFYGRNIGISTQFSPIRKPSQDGVGTALMGGEQEVLRVASQGKCEVFRALKALCPAHIHPSSLSDEVWKNPRFAEVVRLGQPEDLLLLSEAILGALSHPEALSQPQKTTLAYLVISLTEGRKYIRNIAVRHQLDQNLLLICEKGGQSAPSLLWAN